ncbi:hypothetical protein VHUM_00571 [Vanrija humicola]|uniref:Major facilitator superfamily (MFS) profile domain-containing protein n=1 Tax=Vanrija humicola TaxID=5417 RepID=A0A7D8V6M1_VANHU|nr:hypothetical protein VHUM_00571 [Vanrija humicola]
MFAVIFPYINEMMHDFGVPQESVGLWSAAAESALMVTEAVTAPMYAPLADRYGRRAVFVPLVALWAVLALAFGFVKSAVSAVGVRAVLIASSAGVGVISRTIVGELCDKSNRIQCFALFSPSFTIGVTVAPIIGGFLSKPVPRLLPESFTLFVTYPYLLPAIAASATGVAAAWASYLSLPETLPPSLRAARGAASTASERRKLGGLEALVKNKPFQNVLLLYGLANIIMFSWEAIYPLFAFTDKKLGGLQLSTQTIGLLLALGAGLSIVLTIFLFPVLHRIVPENAYLTFCLAQYPIAILLFPAAWAANRDYPVAGRLSAAGWVILVVQLVLRRVGDFAPTLLDTIVLDTIPDSSLLALANSLTFSTAAVCRSVGVFAVSSFFSFSTTAQSPYSLKRQLVWVVFVALCLPSLWFARRVVVGTKPEVNDEEQHELLRVEESVIEDDDGR